MRDSHVALELSSAPSAEPVLTAEAKSFLRVTVSDDDTLIAALIKAAREKVENHIGRKLITQTWNIWYDNFPNANRDEPIWEGVVQGHINILNRGSDFIRIPIAPVASVTSLTTYATDDTATVFSSDNYLVDTVSLVPRVILNQGQVWPSALRNRLAIKIIIVAGYGADGDSVPEAIITAMLQLIAFMYEHRGDQEMQGAKAEGVTFPSSIINLLDPFIVKRFA